VTETIVILNPTAGSPEHIRSWQERVESLAGDCPVRVTSHPGEAEELAQRAIDEGHGSSLQAAMERSTRLQTGSLIARPH